MPLRIGVTGATGFVGQNLIPVLLGRGHQIFALSRDKGKAEGFPWFSQVNYLCGDIDTTSDAVIETLAACDRVIHLAWPGLPNYGELFHIEINYPMAYRFIKRLSEKGLKRITVTGTCFEYGMKNGCLSEDIATEPVNPYGLAKDFLRRSLECLSEKSGLYLQWARLFYLHGSGQSPGSLLSQLDAAIERGDTTFKMSSGEQLRDYSAIHEAVNKLTLLAERSNVSGIFNICSGIPVSIRTLVESRLRQNKASIKLELGHFPYSRFEPHAFWGDPQKLNRILRET
jgi:nucleoside-diphosphate-sugar epimerase